MKHDVNELCTKAVRVVAVAVALGMAPCPAGQLVQVNLADNAGPTIHGPAGGAGSVWNAWSPLAAPLRDSAGNPTPVGFSLAGSGPCGDWWCDLELLCGGVYLNGGGQIPLVISGLVQGRTYDLYLVSARGTHGEATAFHCANRTDSAADQTADNRAAGNGTTWVRGENYVVFRNVEPDESGSINVTCQGLVDHAILNGFQLVETGVVASTFEAWAALPAHGLAPGVNDGPMDDPDFDGIVNIIEFGLGGEPMVRSPEILPRMEKSPEGWVFAYDRNDLSRPPATTQVVEYSPDLQAWSAVTVPAVSDNNAMITPDGTSDHVEVFIPDTGQRMFGRLKVSR